MFREDVSIAFESTLERDFLRNREFNLNVLDVIPQPCKIPFITKGGQIRTYTPDFLVYYRLGSASYHDYPKPMLVEVKPSSEWRKHWRKWLPKWRAAYSYAKAQGWEFRIHDEQRIRGKSLENIKFLDRYKRMRFPPEESRAVLETVGQMGSAPIHYILARHFMGIYRDEGIAHIWSLLATRRLDCVDLRLELTRDFH